MLLDLVMPGGGGVAALPRLLALSTRRRACIVLTSFGADDQALAAVRAGASGWLGKDVPPSELESAIRTVHRGGSVLDPAVAGRVLSEVAHPGGARRRASTSSRRASARCWPCSARGSPNKELAARLFVAEKTVKTHVSAVLSKLHLTDRTQAALFAVRHGLRGAGEVLGPAAEAQAIAGPMAIGRGRPYRRGMTTTAPTAIVTGASRGLGLALARSLADDGWALVVDGRHAADLAEAVDPARGPHAVIPVVGDITDEAHRDDLATAAASLGGLDLVVLNAGTLGPSPLPVARRPRGSATSARPSRSNLVAQLGVVQALLPHLRPGATDRRHHLRRGGRALRGLGRLRRRQGRLRAARRRPRRRATRPPRAARRPGRHAHPDAPGRLPRRGHLRPPRARGRACPGCER